MAAVSAKILTRPESLSIAFSASAPDRSRVSRRFSSAAEVVAAWVRPRWKLEMSAFRQTSTDRSATSGLLPAGVHRVGHPIERQQYSEELRRVLTPSAAGVDDRGP